MNTFLFMLASTAVGWLLGTRTTQRQLDARFADFERKMAAPPPLAAPVEEPKDEELDEETLLILSASIAAFLGKKARIRRVRRLQPGFSPWSQQGRVNIMGSHDVRHHA